MIISLVGFMGTGKSLVGQSLAKEINFKFYDTDYEIEKSTGLTIAKIFADYEEDYFRKLEKDTLIKLINKKENIVLATGGGIVLEAENRKVLQKKTVPFLLRATAEEIYDRLKNDQGRPLLAVDDPLEEIRRLLNDRKRLYEEFANKVDTDQLSVKEIVELIIRRVKEKR